MDIFTPEIVKQLQNGDIGVIPTDTLYGIVGRADIPATVERIYATRGRNPHKPCIVLIPSFDALALFSISVPHNIESFLIDNFLWPGMVSVVFDAPHAEQMHLTRGTGSIAFRMPHPPALRELLKQTGPLIAPSANKEGEPPAQTVTEARAVFGSEVDFYVDGGTLTGEASTLISILNGEIQILRQGVVSIPTTHL